MNNQVRKLAFAAIVTVSFVIVGCGNGAEMSQKEIDSVNTSPPMTDANRSQVARGMAEGGAKSRQNEADWAKAHAADVARINAERAKMGRPPLGGG
jgi:hypothetical protein